METKGNAKLEWPKEKLLHYGAGKLSKSELLAVILHSGTKNLDVIELAKNILRVYPKFSLAEADVAELEKKFDLDPSKICEMIACFELGKRMAEDDKLPADPAGREAKGTALGIVPEDDMLAKFGTENFLESKP